uniref:Uncharacterized protein n=1 Tax=Arundo donax TaxID=35708 RepID=A0A0A9H760_ARUDO
MNGKNTTEQKGVGSHFPTKSNWLTVFSSSLGWAYNTK